MAIGVKVDPTLVAFGRVVLIAERHEYLSDEAKAAGVVAKLERHDVLLFQESGAQLSVRVRLDRNGVPVTPLPRVGEFWAVEARVSEGSFRDDAGREREYVNLVFVRIAENALDQIMSNYSAQQKKAA